MDEPLPRIWARKLNIPSFHFLLTLDLDYLGLFVHRMSLYGPYAFEIEIYFVLISRLNIHMFSFHKAAFYLFLAFMFI